MSDEYTNQGPMQSEGDAADAAVGTSAPAAPAPIPNTMPPAPPLDLQPTGQSNLQQVMSDLSGPQQQPQPPKHNRWANVLLGALQGLAEGGVVGAGVGAVFNKDLAAQRQANAQTRQANVSWAQARAAQAIAQASNEHNVIEQQNADWKEAHADRAITRMQVLQSIGLSPVSIIDDNATAAAQAASKMVFNHQVPFVLHIPAGDGSQGQIAVYDVSPLMQAKTVPAAVKDGLDLLGVKVSDEDFARMSPDQRFKTVQTGLTGIHYAPAGTSKEILNQINDLTSKKRVYGLAHVNDVDLDAKMQAYDTEIKSLREAYQTLQTGERDEQKIKDDARGNWQPFQGADGKTYMVNAKTGETKLAGETLNAKVGNAKGGGSGQPVMLMGNLSDGSVVAGTADELKAWGAEGGVKLPSSDVSKVLVARQMTAPNGLLASVAGDIAILQKNNQLGPLASRWNDFFTGKWGSGDQNYAKLKSDMDLISTALMQAHVGAKGGNEMLSHFKETVGDPSISDAGTLLAKLSAVYEYMEEKSMRPRREAK